jgi:hypothetical protein
MMNLNRAVFDIFYNLIPFTWSLDFAGLGMGLNIKPSSVWDFLPGTYGQNDLLDPQGPFNYIGAPGDIWEDIWDWVYYRNWTRPGEICYKADVPMAICTKNVFFDDAARTTRLPIYIRENRIFRWASRELPGMNMWAKLGSSRLARIARALGPIGDGIDIYESVTGLWDHCMAECR